MQRFDVQPSDIIMMSRETRKRCLIVDTEYVAKYDSISTTRGISRSRDQVIAANMMLTRSKEGVLSFIHCSESSRLVPSLCMRRKFKLHRNIGPRRARFGVCVDPRIHYVSQREAFEGDSSIYRRRDNHAFQFRLLLRRFEDVEAGFDGGLDEVFVGLLSFDRPPLRSSIRRRPLTKTPTAQKQTVVGRRHHHPTRRQHRHPLPPDWAAL
jgi:hypothetical protein